MGVVVVGNFSRAPETKKEDGATFDEIIAEYERVTNDAVNCLTLSAHEEGVDVNDKRFINDMEVVRWLVKGAVERLGGVKSDSNQMLDALLQNLELANVS